MAQQVPQASDPLGEENTKLSRPRTTCMLPHNLQDSGFEIGSKVKSTGLLEVYLNPGSFRAILGP